MLDVAEWISKDPIAINGMYGKSDYSPNMVQQWCPSDTEELFDSNLRDPASSARLAELGWTRTSITYRFNNHGFRTPDDWDIDRYQEGNMFLGCSVTMGIGLNIEDTWAYKISSMLGGRFYNLAQAGTGLETQYRMLKSWAPILRPRRIFTLGAFEPRREFLGNNDHRFLFTPMTQNVENSHLAPFIFSEREIGISIIRTVDAMKAVAASIGAELWQPLPENILAAGRTVNAGKSARDLIHVGKGWHDFMAESAKNWTRLV